MGVSSAQDIVAVQDYYGLSSDWVERLEADIENGVVIPGMTLEGMVSVALDAGADLSDMLVNPDMYADEGVQDVVQEAWGTAAEGTELYNDCQAYLESIGIPTDALNQAIQILAENEANQSTNEDGEVTYEVTDAMLEDLYEMAIPMGPIAMSMVSAFQTASWAGEASEDMGDKFEDLSEEMGDILDEIEDISYDDSDSTALAEAQAQSQILSTKLGMMQTTFKILQDCNEAVKEIATTSAEQLATLNDSGRRLSEFILNKW